MATANTRAFVLDELEATEGGAGREALTNFLRALGWLDMDKEVEQWPYRFVPTERREIDKLKLCLGQFALDSTKFIRPYQPHGFLETPLQSTSVAPVAKPAVNGWTDYPMPTGKLKGKPLGQVPVAELEFMWSNFTVRETVDTQKPDGEIVSEPVAPEVLGQTEGIEEDAGPRRPRIAVQKGNRMKKHTRKSTELSTMIQAAQSRLNSKRTQKVCAALAPLTQDRRIKVVKAAAIMLGVDIN